MYCSNTPAFHTGCWAASPFRGFGECSFLGSTLRKSNSPFPEVPGQVLSEQSGCRGSVQALQGPGAGCRTFVQPGQCLAGSAALTSQESQCWAQGGCRLIGKVACPAHCSGFLGSLPGQRKFAILFQFLPSATSKADAVYILPW